MFSRFNFLAAFGLLFVSPGFSQSKKSENYSETFSTNYQHAIQFLQKEKTIDSTIRSYELNPKEVTAIVFPELIRYNTIRDKIEIFALESLYVQYGKDYANFSVSEFQIKPSFAESVEIDFVKLFGKEELFTRLKIIPSDTVQNQVNRSKRLKRIKNKTGMAAYLCLFFRIMEAHYPEWRREDEKLRFFACAYNCGYEKPKEEIEKYLSKNFFYVGLSITSAKYSYADIAWYYFNQ